LLMMVVLVLLLHFGEVLGADGFFGSVYLCIGPAEYFVGLDAVVAVLDKFAVLHHLFHIIIYPGLLFDVGHLATHIAKQLLCGKGADIVGAYLDVIGLYKLVGDKCPFERVDKRGVLAFYLIGCFGLIAAVLHPALEEGFRESDAGVIDQGVVYLVGQLVAA